MLTCKQFLSARARPWVALSVVVVLQGCVLYSQKEHFLEPTPLDFQAMRETPPLYADTCRMARDKIVVPLGKGVLLRLRVVKGIENTGTGQEHGKTLFGELYIPAGLELRFVEDAFIAREDTSQEKHGAIADLTRTIYYAPKPHAGSSAETLRLSTQAVLKGWTAEKARTSGEIPDGSFVDGELHNVFRFVVRWESLDAEQFIVRTPDLEIGGEVTGGKTISFRQVEEKVFYNSMCS